MLGYPYEVVCETITNTIATVGGMVCDGAKSSCAAKISTALQTALLGMKMGLHDRAFQPGEGLVEDDVEETIRSIGRMGRDGMHSTDLEILNIMLEIKKRICQRTLTSGRSSFMKSPIPQLC